MFVTRFAPSPTGYLHLGHAFSALSAFDCCRRAGGQFVLRIEDIDQGRCRPAYEAAIYEDLAWLGIVWAEPVWRQSQRMNAYQDALATLIDMGLVYRCFKTRKELAAASAQAPHDLSEPYIGQPLPADEEAHLLARDMPFAWRLSIQACQAYLGDTWQNMSCQADGTRVAVRPEVLGDVILARKDVPTSYHLASVVDDGAQGITHIIRGEDLASAVHIQVLLQNLLGLPTPIYQHHRLIHDEAGVRLAKRHQSMTLTDMRKSGTTPQQIREQLGLQA